MRQNVDWPSLDVSGGFILRHFELRVDIVSNFSRPHTFINGVKVVLGSVGGDFFFFQNGNFLIVQKVPHFHVIDLRGQGFGLTMFLRMALTVRGTATVLRIRH